MLALVSMVLMARRAVALRTVVGPHAVARAALRTPRWSTKDPQTTDVLAAPGADVLRSALSKDGFVSAKVADCTNSVREALLLGAFTSVVLIADGIEDEEIFQVRFEGDGPLRGLLAASNGRLEARGYVGNPKFGGETGELVEGGVARGVGVGTMQVVRLKNLPGEEFSKPISSIVDIISGEVAEDINHYVATSEQREGALGAGVLMDAEDGTRVKRAAGWRIDLLPGAPEDVVDALIANMKALLDANFSITDLLESGKTVDDAFDVLLDGMDPQIFDVARHPKFKCQCGMDRVYRTLALLPRPEVKEIVEKNDKIEVRCEFCCKLYTLSPDDINSHLAKVDAEAAAAEPEGRP